MRAAFFLLLLPACVTPSIFASDATHRDLVYASPNGYDLKLDLYLPAPLPTAQPSPLIVWIHGGAWRSGDRKNPPGTWLVAKGYALASISYRLTSVASFPAQIHDCKAAIRWLRANAAKYKLDPARIGVWGPSAGGHLVALLGTSGGVSSLEGSLGNGNQSSRVQAVVDYFGPTDLPRMAGYPSSVDHVAPDSPESQLLGGPLLERKEIAAAANPITYITPDDPPFLIVNGDRDDIVPPSQNDFLAEALRKANLTVTHHVIPGAGHGGPAFQTPAIRTLVEQFFDRHLRRP